MKAYRRTSTQRAIALVWLGAVGGLTVVLSVVLYMDHKGPPAFVFWFLGLLLLLTLLIVTWALESYLVHADSIQRRFGSYSKRVRYDRITAIRFDPATGDVHVRAGWGGSLRLAQRDFGNGLGRDFLSAAGPGMEDRIRAAIERGEWVEFREPSHWPSRILGVVMIGCTALTAASIGENLLRHPGLLVLPLIPFAVAVYLGFRSVENSGSGLSVHRSGLRRRGAGEPEVPWSEVVGVYFDERGLNVQVGSGETPLRLGRGAWNYVFVLEAIRPWLPASATVGEE